MIKVDIKDKKILYELDVDCRTSASQIGKKLNISKETVNYRINKMIDNGTIKGFITEINMAKLGLTTYKVYYQFQYLDGDAEKKLVQYLTSHPNVFWVARSTGRWDMLTMILAKDAIEFYHVLEEIIEKFHKHILNKAFLINLEVLVFRREYLLPFKHELHPTTLYAGEIKREPCDDLDKKLLKILAKNARLPTIEIARKLNSTPRVVSYRIKELIKKKIITSFRVLIDLKQINYLFFKIFVYLENMTKENKNTFFSYCRQKPNVTYISNVAGPWDIELEVEVESDEKFNEIMWDIRNKFSNIIRNAESVLVTKDYDLNYEIP